MRWTLNAAIALALMGVLGAHPASVSGAFACPVTIPNDSQPPPGGGSLGPGTLSTHGNGLLWTILPDDGVWRLADVAMRPDGSFKQKFVWWRRPVGQTFAGNLQISGRRLDAASDPLTAAIRPPEGVHVGSTIEFPSGGCWEVTGTAGADSMTFTVYMLPPGDALPNTAMPHPAPWAAMGASLLLCAVYLMLVAKADQKRDD